MNVTVKFSDRSLLVNLDDLRIPWSNSHIQGPNAVVLSDRVRVFFSSRVIANGLPISIPGFFDLDRANPLKVMQVSSAPILGLGELGHFDEFGIYPASVIMEPSGSFTMAYGGWTRADSVRFDVAIGLAMSSDGQSFKKLFPGPILGRDSREPFVLSSPKLRRYNGRYYLFYIAGHSWSPTTIRVEPNYRIRVAVSEDLIIWKRLNKDIIPAALPLESQASPDVFYRDGKYHMLFCFRDATNYMKPEGSYRIGYAFSEDLINWTRSEAGVDLAPEPSGWDSEMVAYPNVFELDGTLWLLYSGNGVGMTGVGIAKVNIDTLA